MVGRPRLADETKRVSLIVDLEWLNRIATWRTSQPKMTRSDAIRHLLGVGLDMPFTAGDRRSIRPFVEMVPGLMPRKVDTKRVVLIMPTTLLKKIGSWYRLLPKNAAPDFMRTSEAVRRLVELGLDADEARITEHDPRA